MLTTPWNKSFSHLTFNDLEQLYNYRSGLLTKVEANQVLRLLMNHEKRFRKHICTKVPFVNHVKVHFT